MLLYTADSSESTLESFDLSGRAEIIVLQTEDEIDGFRIPVLPGAPSLLELDFEYMGSLEDHGHVVYRITLMPDNERMLFIFCLGEQFSVEIKEWLQDQLAWSEVFAGH